MTVTYPRAALVILALLVVGGVLSAASTSTASFGSYNADWNGVSDFRELSGDPASVDLVRNVTAYEAVEADRSVAFVLSPTRPYSEAEASHLRSFVRAGGTLVVAEDVGPYGSGLLQSVGATARFDGAPLRDERYHAEGPDFPVAGNVTDHPLTVGVDDLTLNYGTAVEPGSATVLVRTSEYAYLDRTRNEDLDAEEMVAASPVATIEAVADGQVIAVGDPSVFINAMLDQRGNRAFAQNLLAGSGRVLLDYSHAADSVPPLVRLLLVVRDSSLVQIAIGLAAVGLLGLWARRPGLLARISVDPFPGTAHPGRGPGESQEQTNLDRETLARVVSRRHPDWDDERVERVIAGIIHRRGEADRDD